MSEKISRRKYIGAVGAAATAAVIGGVIYYLTKRRVPSVLETLSLASPWDDKELEFFEGEFQKFEEDNPYIKIKVTTRLPPNTDVQHDTIATWLNAGSSDVDLIWADLFWIPEFANQGWLEPIDDVLTTQKLQQFLPAEVDITMWGDHAYRLGISGDMAGIYYRKDLLNEYDFDPPTTWEELVEQAQFIVEKERAVGNTNLVGFTWQGAQYEGLVCDYYEYLWANGGELLDEKGRPSFNSDEGVEALQFMCDLIYKYKISPPEVLTYHEEESRIPFCNGEAVFHRNWCYAWCIAQEEDSPIRGKIGAMLGVPVGPRGEERASNYGGWGFALSKYSKHKEAAKKFLSYMAEEEVHKRIIKQLAYGPVFKSFYEDPEIRSIHPFFGTPNAGDILHTQGGAARIPVYSQLSDVLQSAVHSALTKTTDPKSALEYAAREWSRILGI